MELISTIIIILTPSLSVLALLFSFFVLKEKEKMKREGNESEEQKKRQYIKENRHVFGIYEKGITEMGSEQEIFTVSTKEMGISERTEKRRS